ncbi:glycosyltransferase [Collinsella tanakaei]|uniref:glycosyltransferase n=1 Tax=Collinsella tanakaei TaxID=626935 RepID=UPI0025A3BC04|nr:glycosyltransferase [Collinsella tanakaei]MDM8302548.1 glycosyltransferase [Collinsella tanakaei]
MLPYFGNGGAEHMVSLLASHLNLEQVEPRVFCVYGKPQGNGMESAVLEHGVGITYIEKGLGFSVGALRRLGRELSAFSPDVVHTHLSSCLYCAPWCVLHGVPMLHTIHNIPEMEAASRFRRTLMRLLYCSGRAIPVAISKTNQHLTSVLYNLPDKAVEMVLNPVDTSTFFPGDLRRNNSEYDVISVGRLDRQKNQKMLLDALRSVAFIHKDVRMALVGDGPLDNELKDYVNNNGLQNNVSFLGLRDDVAELMRRSKVFVLSSDFEGLPLSMLEAMSVGLPIVSTRVGGIPDVVDGNGLLVDAGDAKALAAALCGLLENEKKREVMSKRSLELSRQYDVNTVAQSYEELYVQYAK